jgi:pimeloyl-ACP methyl ester carboxylesterase
MKKQKIISKNIIINGIKTRYLEAGEGKPMVLIHGIFSSSIYLKGLIKVLQKHFKIYAVDLPMHGQAGRPKKHTSLEEFTEFVAEFIRQLKLDKPIVLGFSGGAMIAISYVLKHAVEELILIDPAGLILQRLPVIKRMGRHVVQIIKYPHKRLPYLSHQLKDHVRNRLSKYYMALIKGCMKIDFIEHIKNIAVPTTIFWGEKDEIFPLKLAEQYKNLIKNAKLHIVKGGHHDWPLIRPKEILKWVEEKFKVKS